MLATWREWAVAEGLSPDAIEKMYSALVNHFIAEEMEAVGGRSSPELIFPASLARASTPWPPS